MSNSSEKSEENNKSKELSVKPAKDFNLQYPDNKFLNKNEKEKIQKGISNGGIAIGTNTYVNQKNLKDILSTDVKGTQIMMNNATKSDIKTYGGEEYLSTPQINKELSARKEKPLPQLMREKLKYAQDCLETFSENPELNKMRSIESDRVAKGRSTIGKETIKKRKSTVSELTGEPLEGDAEVHHKNRVADSPEEAFDEDNLVVLKKSEHDEFHKSEHLQNKEGFDEFAKNKK